MRQVRPGDNPLLQEDEVAWCETHPEVPEAAVVLDFHRRSMRGDIDPTHPDFGDAVLALRAVHSRPPTKVDRLFTYLAYDPIRRVEAFVQSQPVPGGWPRLMAALDLMHMRTLLPEARGVQRQTPHPLKLWSFRFDRVVPEHKILHLRGVNVSMRRCEEIFAYVGVMGGDEVVAAVGTARSEPQLLLTVSAAGAKVMREHAVEFRKRGTPIELRRFVRDYEVKEFEFELREAGRA